VPAEELVPTYQYACTACGHRFEAVQSFSDASLSECPECAGRLRKVFSSVGIVFKGSGFYRTDSRGGATGSDTKEPAKDTSSTTAKDGGSAGKDGAAAKKADAGSGASSTGSSSGSSSSSSSSSSGSSSGSGGGKAAATAS
jgi:putative FmdB family regulatory protein